MKKLINLFLSLLLLFSASSISAQKTGSFETTINFNSENRKLACYVPQDYSTSNTYQLIIALHGAGDNSVNYRNALVNSLKWPSLFTQSIIICPDGGSDANKSFHTPIGDEAIIQAAIDYAKSNYTIDANDVLLQGFSLGGRSALKYGLENPSKFKGLLLNTPAIQGVADALNDTSLGFGFDYKMAKQMPIYLSYGANDAFYTDVLALLSSKLIMEDAKLFRQKVAGLGHQIAGISTMNNAPAFFSQPELAGLDLEVFQIETNNLACSENLSSSIIVRNLGTGMISQIDFVYKVGTKEETYTWNGSLASFEHQSIKLPSISAGSGMQSLIVTASSVNAGETEIATDNNSASKSIYVSGQAQSLPFNNDFEGQMEAWTLTETNSIYQWYIDSDVSKGAGSSMSNLNNIFVFYNAGYEESFNTPTLDLTSSDAPSLAFDLAFNYHKYTPPYFSIEVRFADTLIVSISTDCGQTFTELYKKGGAELATADEPILNPLSIQACFFKPTSEQWRTESIDLEDFKTEKEAIIKFAYKSALGGNIYIDNINFDRALSLKDEAKESSFSIYPNPATNQVTLHFDSERQREIKVYDALGHVMDSFQATSDYQFDISHYAQGMYSIEVTENGQRYVKKLIKVN